MIAEQQHAPNPSGPIDSAVNVATHYDLAAGDYVELFVDHDIGGNLDVRAISNSSPEFGMVKLP